MPKQQHSIPFGGQSVAAVAVKVTNAGDGLSEAMRVDPVDLRFGQRVYQVIEGFVTKAEVAPANHLDPQGDVIVKYTIKAGTSTLVDQGTVIEAIDITRNRILRAQEEAAAQKQLEGTERPVEGAPPAQDDPDGFGTDADGFHDPALVGAQDAAPAEPTEPIGRKATQAEGRSR
jgi:hypothetical protein